MHSYLEYAPATISRYINNVRIPTWRRLIQISNVVDRRLILQINNEIIQAKFELKELKREVTFDEKIQQCSLALMKYCISRMHLLKEDAEDTVQETIYRALTMHYTWRPEISMMTWLIGIAKKVKDRRNGRLIYVNNYIESGILSDESEQTFREHSDLFHYIENLNPVNKKYYKLYLNGIPYKQIALQMNVAEFTVKRKIKTIKLALSEKIRAQAG